MQDTWSQVSVLDVVLAFVVITWRDVSKVRA